jgi:hypothetical protein
MARKKLKKSTPATKLVYYRHGPEAMRGNTCWTATASNGGYGCAVAEDVGAEIPSDTYTTPSDEWADTNIWDSIGNLLGGGWNTAILPIEVRTR